MPGPVMARANHGGGKRPGAGRPKGSKNKATLKAKQSCANEAQKHMSLALSTLVEICKDKDASSSARVTAAIAILDRGFGKPVQSTEHSGPTDDDGNPTAIPVSVVVQYV